MMNVHTIKWLRGVANTSTRANSSNRRATSFTTLFLLLILVLSSSACIGLTSASKAGSAQSSNSTNSSAPATMLLSPAAISFGSVAVGATVSQTVTISNSGGSPLTISQASSSTSGVSVSGISLPLVIAAGTGSSFKVTYTPKSSGALAGNISIVSDLSTTAATISLSGTGTSGSATLLNSSASSVNFGNVTVGKADQLTFTLTNAGNSQITISNVVISGAGYSTSGVSSGLILAPGQSATVDATFTPAGTGSAVGSLTVSSNATNSPAVISFTGDGTSTQPAAHSVSLTWTQSSSQVAGYNVYRSEISGGPYSKLDSALVTAETYTDASVQPGLTYYYVVTSVTAAGVESADSPQATAAVPTT